MTKKQSSNTLFISYGGPDEQYATKINNSLRSKGIKTWFFPEDAKPGDKLHRTMYEGVNNYDYILLVCSKNSLTRNGVLNEIERALEREAKEGGTSILIPVSLDDYVYEDWAPDRPDLSDQIRSRVITSIKIRSKDFETSINRIANALKS